MSARLTINLDPETIDEGSPEERSAFGIFSIRAGNIALTEGYDFFVRALRPGPLVSGYAAAEWFAWNWWRLRYEPYSPRSPDWWHAHQMTAIGEGYVWPNVTFRSDGIRVAIIADPSTNPEAKPFRYVGAPPWLGSATMLEEALETFINSILARLRGQGVGETNLDRIWSDVIGERRDPAMAERRRLEALLGHDPDYVAAEVIQALLTDRETLGAAAIDELAADAAGEPPPRASELLGIAIQSGIEACSANAVRLSPAELAKVRKEPVAWRQGREAAQALRAKEALGATPIATARLLKLLGAADRSSDLPRSSAAISFLLNHRTDPGRVVLRSRWETGRRFELARLLGDHLFFGKSEMMLPATRAYTFRQKTQRSFAAEFLSPFEAVEEMLHGDFSPEAVEGAAEHFNVSPMMVETLLRNHGQLERHDMADAA